MLGFSPPLGAADLIVEENGVLPNYSTIQAAVDAANPGDRIFVKNQSGGIPYLENVTINKSIELLPFTANGNFLVFGNYTITPSAVNFTATYNYVRIVGMKNEDGNINAITNNTTANVIRIDLHGNELEDGSFNILSTGYESHISGNKLHVGNIRTREATITGNQLSGLIEVNDAAATVGPNEPEYLYIVGNRIATDMGSFTGGRIQWTNSSHSFFISNNFLSSNANGAIIIVDMNSSATPNRILNNAMEQSTTFGYAGILVTYGLILSDRLQIRNNAMHDGYDGDDNGEDEYLVNFAGGVASTALVEISYNVHQGLEEGLTNAPGHVLLAHNTEASVTFDIDNFTGESTAVEVVDEGHPGAEHIDLDLTRNDRGVAGGSFHFDNFFPILTGAARVYLVKAPRTVIQGSTFDAEAEAHDR